MKAGKKMKDVKAELLSQGAEAMMIENCGMPDEKIYRTSEEIPEDAGYYSLIINQRKQRQKRGIDYGTFCRAVREHRILSL